VCSVCIVCIFRKILFAHHAPRVYGYSGMSEKKNPKRRNIYWSDDVDKMVEGLSKERGFPSVSEFLRALILHESQKPTVTKGKKGEDLRTVVRELVAEELAKQKKA